MNILKTYPFRQYLAYPIEKGNYIIIQQGDNPILGYANGKPFDNFNNVILFGDHTVSLYKPLEKFFIATDGIKILGASNFDRDYLFSLLEFYKPEPQGYKRHFSILKNIEIWYTDNKIEQQKIGHFFNQLDQLITLHQRKLENVKKLKKSLLQKMFPKNGSQFPEIRFPEFTDAWEQRKLGEISNIKTGSSDLQDADENGNYPFFVRSEKVERSNQYIFDGEAILIPGEGRLGDIYHYIDGKFDYHQRVYKISNFKDSNVNGKFVLYEMNTNFKKHALKHTVKATVDSLRLPTLLDYIISLPQLAEQQKIGHFFSQLDQLITLHQRKEKFR
ncbi:restriction endonuclease subunit S [Volucribacter amazonae]|uniref:Type I restriction modification DNA specificity domain-containing protein n=1 Tax=Volucribacter amazonae TaxID=256731 RepID=A0A9X4PCE8_9PAST|nr:restriction endonuclease subunit S [Volucribacter amazonae]MDG6894991.1 hypothetical protein [Volucribacter amazonae]